VGRHADKNGHEDYKFSTMLQEELYREFKRPGESFRGLGKTRDDHYKFHFFLGTKGRGRQIGPRWGGWSFKGRRRRTGLK